MMITRCPECATAFRVTPAQLEARHGRVRCGHCGEVFDALKTLESIAEPAPVSESPAAPETAAPTPEQPGSAASSEAFPRDAEQDHEPVIREGTVISETDDADPTLETTAGVQPGDENLGREANEEAPQVPCAEAQEPKFELAEDFCATDLTSEKDRSHEPRDPAPWEATMPDPAGPAGESAHTEPSPARIPDEKIEELYSVPPLREKRRVSIGWSLVAAALAIALLAQAAFYFRGAVALLWPASKPAIQRLCAQLGCEVPLPRRAELMSIESSDLQLDRANPKILVLSATVRNRAAFPQGYPYLELTLTNDGNEPLARRVLQPADYLNRAPNADEGLPSCMGGLPSCEFQVKVTFEAPSLNASGYRLYLFYP